MWNGIFDSLFLRIGDFFVLRKLIFATRTHWFFSLIINFCDFQKVLSTFPASRGPSWRGKNVRKIWKYISFLLSTYNQGAIEIHILKQPRQWVPCIKAVTSLHPVLFLNERGRLWLNRHDFLVLYFCVVNLSWEKVFSLLSVVFL